MKYSIPKFWRRKEGYYQIVLTKCRECGKIAFFTYVRCPYCGSSNVELVRSSGRGVVEEFTVSYNRVEEGEEYLPRIIAIVRLGEGVRVVGELVDIDPAEVKEGVEVEAVLRRFSSDDPHGLIYYGLKFAPVIKRA
ncbi:MAG: Zn-ribbon domain-containing OB-fold protein [Desulfurococcales archaeon]|nr:Zn-ribbon domain-containing OB-fold protein [Desulfurococcales archaeon]